MQKFACVNERSELPMKRWSYSIPTDQLGPKPYSNPVPTTPPQRVEFAETRSTPVAVELIAKLVFVTAAPPFTYHSQVSQAKPNWPVKRPIPSSLVLSVRAGSKTLMREWLRFAQSP